ncbi:MAG TPA: toprim domain-containing protein, partial [Flavobacteriales bacterium]|nr:toprim domain-containing protein [Flavobacteriales bacterium]
GQRTDAIRAKLLQAFTVAFHPRQQLIALVFDGAQMCRQTVAFALELAALDFRDVIAIESTRQYNGLYHVLGGVISPMEGIGPDELNATELFERVRSTDAPPVREVVLALGGTLEGDTTAFYLNRRLHEMGVLVTTIARGISVGANLDQADEATLGRSIVDRKPYEQSIRK